jgi:2-(1,2-epoxy-1,2-dihydrophenyl)acetyl-CoA isomerase
MPAYTTLLYELQDNVLLLTLNRPDVYNAFNEAMKKEINEAFREAARDPEVRSLVLRGAGDKAFCSGQDLREHAGGKRSLKDSLERSYNPMIRAMRTMEKPIVGMINGVAAGAGCSLALACDMRIMASNAKLIEAFVRIGLVADSGSHWFLPRLAGMAKAFEYATTGREIDAAEAEQFGIVNKVVSPELLEQETMTLARKLAQGPTKAIGLIKRTLNKALTCDLDTLLAYEAAIQQVASETEDHREGVTAFLEKRQAKFAGR